MSKRQELSVAVLTEPNHGFALQTNLLSFSGNFISTKYNLSGAYMSTFQKKEVGSVGQRIQLAPLAGQHASKTSIVCKRRQFRSDRRGRVACSSCSQGFRGRLDGHLRFPRFPAHQKCPQAVFETVSPRISYLSFFVLSANLSSPDNKKDKAKSATAKSISNSSLSETNEGIDELLPASAYDLRCCFAAVLVFLMPLLSHLTRLKRFALGATVTPRC